MIALWSEDEPSGNQAAAYLDSISESCRNEFDGIWFAKSDKRAVEIRDDLKRILGPSSKVTVGLLAGFAAWHGVGDDCEKWLLKHL